MHRNSLATVFQPPGFPFRLPMSYPRGWASSEPFPKGTAPRPEPVSFLPDQTVAICALLRSSIGPSKMAKSILRPFTASYTRVCLPDNAFLIRSAARAVRPLLSLRRGIFASKFSCNRFPAPGFPSRRTVGNPGYPVSSIFQAAANRAFQFLQPAVVAPGISPGKGGLRSPSPKGSRC